MPYQDKSSRNAWYRRKTYQTRLERNLIRARRALNSFYSESSSDDTDVLPPDPFPAVYSDSDSDELPDNVQVYSDIESNSSFHLPARNNSILPPAPEVECEYLDSDNLPNGVPETEGLSAICFSSGSGSSSSSSEQHSSEEETAEADIVLVPETDDEPDTNSQVVAAQDDQPPAPVAGNMEAQLFDFMCDYHITHSSMRSLLKLLNRHKGSIMRKLPREPRTLMNRYVKENDLSAILTETEEFAYLGIRNSFAYLYAEKKYMFTAADGAPLKLSFNFDGLPTSRSTSQEVWPILMSTDLCPELVHVIGVYYGQQKPSIQVLLHDLVCELDHLLRNGFKFDDHKTVHHRKIVLDFVVCDLPALALVKCIKGSTGYASCPKCTVWGEYNNRRMTFIPAVHNFHVAQRRTLTEDESFTHTDPSEPVKFRTHQSFVAQEDKEHHKEITPFLHLEGHIDLIESFTIDGMHTIYLGVVRRFLYFLQNSKKDELLDGDAENSNPKKQKKKQEPGKKTRGRNLISEKQFQMIGALYGSSKAPREFSRQSKDFTHFDAWKATELRQFLLYGGDMAIACPGGGVPPVLVTAFRCLSMAIRLLSDPGTYIRYNQFAKALLVCFVDTSTEYFGKHFMSLIVHILLHLGDECMKFGPLDKFACWKFENTLKSIKKRCRNFKTPLKALANQLRYKSTFVSKPSRDPHYGGNGVHLVRRMCGPGSRFLDGELYRTVFFKNFVLTPDFPDNHFQTQSRQIYAIEEIISTGTGTKLICKSYDKVECAYYVPTKEHRVESTEIGIKRLRVPNPNVHVIDIQDFATKCVVRSYNNSLYCYPLMLFEIKSIVIK